MGTLQKSGEMTDTSLDAMDGDGATTLTAPALRDGEENGGRDGGGIREKVPSFDPSRQTMRDFRRHVVVFELRTRIPKWKQGAELYAELKGGAWDQAEDLDPQSLMHEDGVAELLEYFSRKFDDTKVMEMGDELRKFLTKMRRHSGEAVREYVKRFDGQVARLKLLKVSFPDEALAWL